MSSDSQQQSDRNPQYRGLIPFKPGQSGNPGGNYKRTPKVSNAYARLLAMSAEELEVFKPSNGAEIIAFEQFKNAQKAEPKDQLGAAKEITDRTEGRAPQRIVVDNTSELEKLIIRVQERILAQTGIEISRERALELVGSYRPELVEDLE